MPATLQGVAGTGASGDLPFWGGSIEILKNRIAEGIFGRSFSQRPEK